MGAAERTYVGGGASGAASGAATGSMFGPGGTGIGAGVGLGLGLMGAYGQVEGDKQNKRALNKQYNPETQGQMARQGAIASGMGGGGAQFSADVGAYNQALAQMAQQRQQMQQQQMHQQLQAMMMLSSMARMFAPTPGYGGTQTAQGK